MPTAYIHRILSESLHDILAINDETSRKSKLIAYFHVNYQKCFCEHDEVCKTHTSWSMSSATTTLDYVKLQDNIKHIPSKHPCWEKIVRPNLLHSLHIF